MTVFGVPVQWRQQVFLVGDLIAALVAIWLGHALRFGFGSPDGSLPHILTSTPGACLLFLATSLLFLYVADAYEPARSYLAPAQLLRVWMAVAFAMLAQMVLFYALPSFWWGRGIALLTCSIFAVLASGMRAGAGWLRPPPVVRERTVIVGAGRAGHSMIEVIRKDREAARMYDLFGFVDDQVRSSESGLEVLGGASDLVAITEQYRISLIIVAIRGGMSTWLVEQLLECKARGVRIVDMPTLHKRLTGKVPIHHLADTWLVFGPGFSAEDRLVGTTVRILDIALSLIGLALTWPVIALAALAVRLDSPGPAFFLQERVGKGERPFTIIKLRTMRQDAEAKSGAVWSQGASDPRVTRLGRLLRRTRIDELPQFWNVLRGDMSMVGPRPERAHFVLQLKEKIPYYGLRFAVKPGLTGWAQVMYRYGASEEDAAEKLRYELYAIQEMSLFLYLLIVLKTVQTVLLRPGS